MTAEVVQIMTTAGSRDEAQRIAENLVERRLAACVQISGPIHSTYRWQGNVEQADEWMCLIKTRLELFSEVARAIRALHSYDEPEILAMPIVDGSPGYLAWLTEQTP